MIKRYALVAATPEAVAAYLPGNYSVAFGVRWDGLDQTVIEGQDRHGWTLDHYILPRLASGLYPAREIDLSHDVMRTPEAAEPRRPSRTQTNDRT